MSAESRQLEAQGVYFQMAALEACFRRPGTPLTEDQLLLRKRVLHAIESDPGQFSMRWWDTVSLGIQYGCGTSRCLAGWALHLAGAPASRPEGSSSVERRAVLALGLTHDEFWGRPREFSGSGLFYAGDAEALARLREITEHPQEAADAGS